jgi:hypothetical protein
MPDHARRTGPAVESHYQFLAWLVRTVEKFPKTHKFTLGDRIVVTALDFWTPWSRRPTRASAFCICGARL